MKQNFHIGIMGNLFSGKTTLMHTLAGGASLAQGPPTEPASLAA
jgi:ABC-type phosphate/phosphonate transport system ATPase subunit